MFKLLLIGCFHQQKSYFLAEDAAVKVRRIFHLTSILLQENQRCPKYGQEFVQVLPIVNCHKGTFLECFGM